MEASEPNAHASALTPLIAALMEASEFRFSDLSAVVVAKGPGSYTGLRIGVSTAKGLCYANELPLIGIDSLEALAYGFSASPEARSSGAVEQLLCPMIDARRMEVYCATFNLQEGELTLVQPTRAQIIDETSFDDLENGQRITLFGTGADKLTGLFASNDRIRVVPGFGSTAAALIRPATVAYAESNFENLAYFEPLYLKDFIPTTPRR